MKIDFKTKKKNFNQLLLLLESKILKIFNDESSGHDFYHLIRVKNIALKIQKREGGNRENIAIASLLHDVHRIMQKENGEYYSPKDSLPRINCILRGIGLSRIEKLAVAHIIEHHEEYNFSKYGKNVNDIETLIVQDADNLDSIGAIGIARAFAYSGAYKIPIWLPQNKNLKKYYEEGMHDVSEVHHFYSKLLKLKDNMNTKTGKKIAQNRHKFTQKYLQNFFAEWKGKK